MRLFLRFCLTRKVVLEILGFVICEKQIAGETLYSAKARCPWTRAPGAKPDTRHMPAAATIANFKGVNT